MQGYLQRLCVPYDKRERLTKLVCEHYGIDEKDKDVDILVRCMYYQNQYIEKEKSLWGGLHTK